GNDQLDESSHKYAAQISRGAERLDQLLDDLSKIGRIAAGRIHPQLESVSLQQVVNDLLATNSLADFVTVDAGVDVNVKADPAWLREALHCVVDGLRFEDGIDIRLTWQHEAHD